MADTTTGPNSPDTQADVAQLQAANPVSTVFSAIPGAGELGQQMAGAVNAIAPMIGVVKMLMDRSMIRDLNGNPIKFNKGDWSDPQGMGQRILDWMDKQTFQGVLKPLEEEMKQIRHQLLVNYFKNIRGFSEGAAEQAASRPSLEKFATWALHSLQNRGLNSVLQQGMQMEGISSASFGPQADRKQNAVVNLFAQMYRASSDLSKDTPFQGAISSQYMKSLMEMYQKGAFKQLFRMPGMFDAAGSLTDYGRLMSEQAIRNAGYSVLAWKRLTNQADPEKALAIGKTILGDNFAGYLATPGMDKMLASYDQAARLAGMVGPDSHIQKVSLLESLRRITGNRDPRALLSMGMQKLGFEKMGAYGSPEQWNLMTMRNITDAYTGDGMKSAAVAAAALSQKYGKTAAFNMMHDIIRVGSHYKNGIIQVANKYLDPNQRINVANRDDVQAMVYHPVAQEYMNSGLGMHELTTVGAVKTWNQIASSSDWFRRHGRDIMKTVGSFTPEAVMRYADMRGANAVDKARITRHMYDVAQNVGGTWDPEAFYGWLSAGLNYGQRAKLYDESMKRADIELANATKGSGGFGVEGAMRSVFEGNGLGDTFKSIFGQNPSATEMSTAAPSLTPAKINLSAAPKTEIDPGLMPKTPGQLPKETYAA